MMNQMGRTSRLMLGAHGCHCGEMMEQEGQPEELSGQEKENLSGEVMESLGESENAMDQKSDPEHGKEATQGQTDPLYVQKRLKRAERNHQRELRSLEQKMQQEIQQLHDKFSSNGHHTEPMHNPYTNQPAAASEDERIARAVRFAREQDKLEEQKRIDAEKMQHVNRQYQRLQDNLDKGSDKYDDFHDVVMKDDVPFTPHIRDAVLLLGDDHQADVLYKLAKNPEELSRISKLHPLDQAKEVVKLSHALMGGSGGSKAQHSPHRPLGQVKSTPVISSSVTDKTPASEIRARMKAGKWK